MLGKPEIQGKCDENFAKTSLNIPHSHQNFKLSCKWRMILYERIFIHPT